MICIRSLHCPNPCTAHVKKDELIKLMAQNVAMGSLSLAAAPKSSLPGTQAVPEASA